MREKATMEGIDMRPSAPAVVGMSLVVLSLAVSAAAAKE
jgi:hypothetical protein